MYATSVQLECLNLTSSTNLMSSCQQRNKFYINEWTDKKQKQIFLIYKEIQNGAIAKSYSIWGNTQIFHHLWEGR